MAETVKDADEEGAAVDAEMEDGKKPEEESKKLLDQQDDPEAKIDDEEKKEEGNETVNREEKPADPALRKDETDQPEAAGAA